MVLNGWPNYTVPTVQIDVLAGPSGPVVLSLPPAPISVSGFLQTGVPTLTAGQVWRATDLITTKQLTIVPLSVQGNTATDVLSGKGPTNALVTVQAHCGPSSTSCVVTRLLAADGAGDFATSLASIDIMGGSDLSASIVDADGDRQYAKVGPPAVDGDRDGLANLVDVELEIPSVAFNDALTPVTLGEVLFDGGLMVTVSTAVAPAGVLATALGGAPGAVARLQFCADLFTVDLTAGDVATHACGSLTTHVLPGPVEIRAPDFPAVVSVPTGGTAKLSLLGGLQVENVGATALSVTVGSVTTPVPAGGSFLVTSSLPTSKDQCKNGGWTAFGRFKNQGDCVSFVATKGKNPPAR
ncbi:MAG: hypothetical protein O3B31_13710 [Chloroflexi bacterium]|nr:hypothetical protein [Chloroflexota bacterium]